MARLGRRQPVPRRNGQDATRLILLSPAGTSLSPGAGNIAITGYAPTIAQPQGIAPGVGNITITGYAPSVTQAVNQAINPGAGTIALTGYAPTVAQTAGQTINPGAGGIALTGYAPSVAQTANQALAPGVGSLALTGYAPTVTQASTSPNLVPDVGLIAITGYAPSVTQGGSKVGGDDRPERIEIYERQQRPKKKDEALQSALQSAFDKVMGREQPVEKAVSIVAAAFDEDEDDVEALMLALDYF